MDLNEFRYACGVLWGKYYEPVKCGKGKSLLKLNFYLFFVLVQIDDNRKIYNLFQDTITEYAKKLYLREMSRLEYEAQTFDTKSSLNTVDYTSGMHYISFILFLCRSYEFIIFFKISTRSLILGIV